MGAWSAAILGNDTSCEVYERFIELYNAGKSPILITATVLEEQQENLLYDKTNVWFGLALACWECKALTNEIYSTVKEIIDNKEDLEFCKDLDADSTFLFDREKKLNAFIKKISVEKEKPRLIKKPPIQVGSIYSAGMCLAYKNSSGEYIGVYVTSSEHFKNKGEIKFCFLAFESKSIPNIEMFRVGKLFGLKKLGKEWRDAEYCGNQTSLGYDKFEKEDFFNNVPQIFINIGSLKEADENRWINNFRGGFLDFKSPDNIMQAIEKFRLEWKKEQELSDITLGELLDKVGL